MFIKWVSIEWKGEFSDSQKLIIDDGEGKLLQFTSQRKKIKRSESLCLHKHHEADNAVFYFAFKSTSQKVLITSIDISIDRIIIIKVV